MHIAKHVATSRIPSRVRWHVVATANWLTQALTRVNQAADAALAERHVFHLVLSGGSTPERLYRALAAQQHDWSRWQIWFGDERCLARDDPQRNSRMAAKAWLERVPIPAANIHVIPAELGAEEAAIAYSGELAGVDRFDLVLLGLGQDGHTASLFPDHARGLEPDAPNAIAVFHAPKPPPERITLSARRLSQARCVLFLISGADKQDALMRWRRGVDIPAAAIQPDAGVDLLIDADACPPGETK